VPLFEDYDTEIFFQLYDVAKAIDGTVKAIDAALKAHSDEQQSAILEQLQSVLGLELDAVKAVSAAVFKTDNNLTVQDKITMLDITDIYELSEP